MTDSTETRLACLRNRLALAALVAVALLLVAAALRRIWCVDFWWQWATGRLISESGIPRVDVFSYTVAGQPWIEMRWLYCWALYRLTDAFGLPAAVVAKCLTLLVTFGLVTASVLKRTGLAAAGAVLAVAVLASSQRFYVRPELATFFFFGLFVWILHADRRRRSRWIWVLPLLQVLWTASHTVWILGPCLVGLMFAVSVGEQLRVRRGTAEARAQAGRSTVRLGALLVLTFAACLLNPWGLAGVAFPFQLFGQIRGTAFKEGIPELMGPFEFERGYLALDYYKILIGVVLVSMAVNIRRLDLFWTGLAVSQFYLSYLAIRNIPLFALAAIPFVIDNLQRSEVAARIPRGLAHSTAALLSIAVIGASGWQCWRLATDRFYVDQNDTNQFGVGLATSKYAVGAVDFIEAQRLEGPIFHTMSEGSYLLARGFRVYVDPRQEVYGEQRFADYREAFASPSAWVEAVESSGARVLLFDVPSRGVRFALNSRAWRLVYFDEVATVFVRSSAPGPPSASSPVAVNAAVVRARERMPPIRPERQTSPWERVRSPAPYRNFARMLILLGRDDAARGFLRDAAALAPSSAPLRSSSP